MQRTRVYRKDPDAKRTTFSIPVSARFMEVLRAKAEAMKLPHTTAARRLLADAIGYEEDKRA